jgi:hypothetical protein
MRHLFTMIAALVITPVVWLLVSFGQDRTAQALSGQDVTATTGDLVGPLLLLGCAGILLGLIATLRFSPAGAGLAGALYLGSFLVLLASPRGLLHAFTYRISVGGWHADLSTPLRTGTALLIGAVLLVSVASVGRWRRWPRRTPAAAGPAGPFEIGATPPVASRPQVATSDETTPWISSLRGGEYGATNY